MLVEKAKFTLVTGGAGFIGSHLVEELLRHGQSVTVLGSSAPSHWKRLSPVADHIEMRQHDLARDDLRPLLADGNCETIFHLAGFANIPESVHHAREDFQQNAAATFNLLEAVRDTSPATRVLFTSSAAVYGEGRGEPLTEDDPTLPVAPYGVSKLAADRYMEIFARLYGLRTATLRLFAIYGPRLHSHVIYDLIRKVHENPDELSIHGDGTQVRDFTYVTNVVDALLFVAEHSELRGEVYNLGSDEPVSICRLAEMICLEMKADPKFLFSGVVRPGVARRWYADTSRIKSLGYHRRVPLAEGLARTVAWYLADAAAAAMAG